MFHREHWKQTNMDTQRSVEVKRVETLRSAESITAMSNEGLPNWLQKEADDILSVGPGQLVNVEKRSRDQRWVYATIMHGGPQEQHGNSGWFPAEHAGPVSPALQQEYSERLKKHDESDYAPPATWTNVDTMGAKVRLEPVGLDSAEGRAVVANFDASIVRNGRRKGRVTRIQRIQNKRLWKLYRMYELEMLDMYPKDKKQDLVCPNMFHGTTHEIASKIMQQGFNRSYCGRNACVHGKGSYFSYLAWYSAQTQYATPRNGRSLMFQCRVVKGKHCLGKNGALTPDVFQGDRLYDSTVDNMQNPSMVVTYSDPQAFAEYLIEFEPLN